MTSQDYEDYFAFLDRYGPVQLRHYALIWRPAFVRAYGSTAATLPGRYGSVALLELAHSIEEGVCETAG